MPYAQVMMFQTIAPSSAPRMTFGSTKLCSIIPPPTAFATATPPVNRAAKLNTAAQITAARGLRTRVPTIVAMEFAESWKPLMKSNRNAMTTMPTTYQITVAWLGVFQRDALHRERDAHALVDRQLERLVDLLPADHLDRVGLAREERPHRVVVERVPLLLEQLDGGRLGRRLARLLDRQHRLADELCGAKHHVRHPLRRLAHLVDV